MIDDRPLSPDEFIQAENIGRSTLFKAWREGWGPEFYFIGKKKLISPEARMAWRRLMIAKAKKVAA